MRKWLAMLPVFISLALYCGCINNPPKESTTTTLGPTVTFEEDCGKLEEQVDNLITEANYCDTDSDCTVPDAYPGCPFGCYLIANKNANLVNIMWGVKEYQNNCPRCIYDCITPPRPGEVKCKVGKCGDIRFEPKTTIMTTTTTTEATTTTTTTTSTTTTTLPFAFFEDNCTKLGEQVDALIIQANYCNVGSDCTVSYEYPGCPFACYMIANKNANLSVIMEGARKYQKNCPKCMLSCMIPPRPEEVKCKAGKCIDIRFEPKITDNITVELGIHDLVPKTLVIQNDGTVTFKEGNKTNETKISSEEVEYLKKYISDGDFFYLRENYEGSGCCDFIAHTINITMGYRTHAVYCYNECPRDFEDIKDKIKSYWPGEITYTGFA